MRARPQTNARGETRETGKKYSKAKEAELPFRNKLGKPMVRNKVTLKLQETPKSSGIERAALTPFDTWRATN
jgi:hypothetical protein